MGRHIINHTIATVSAVNYIAQFTRMKAYRSVYSPDFQCNVMYEECEIQLCFNSTPSKSQYTI